MKHKHKFIPCQEGRYRTTPHVEYYCKCGKMVDRIGVNLTDDIKEKEYIMESD